MASPWSAVEIGLAGVRWEYLVESRMAAFGRRVGVSGGSFSLLRLAALRPIVAAPPPPSRSR